MSHVECPWRIEAYIRRENWGGRTFPDSCNCSGTRCPFYSGGQCIRQNK